MTRTSLLLPALLLLSACSATKFVYNKLDWFASWQVGKYVELKGPVEDVFNSGFDALWQWHRDTQLALYAKDLRELADAAEAPLTAPQAEEYMRRANAHAERMLDEALPGAVKVFQAMSDAQIAGMLRRIAEKRAEELEEDADMSADERRKKNVERMHKNMKRWLGSVSAEQKQHVQEWVASRRSDPALWQRYSEEWAGAFAALLAVRAEPEFGARLRRLMLDPQLPSAPAVAELQLENQRASVALLTQLSSTLSAAQRTHFQGELRGLAQDLEILAAEADKTS